MPKKNPDKTEFEVISFRVPPELAEQARGACYEARLKFVEFARAAFEREIERLQKKHNFGHPFPKRPK
jgi:hypothetical protein